MLEIIRKILKTGIVTKKRGLKIAGGASRSTAQKEDAGLGGDSKKKRQIFGKSLHIRHLDSGSCNGCDFEMNLLTSPVYDIQRFGVDFVASPRHADLLLVTGAVTRNLETAVIDTYNAAAHPKIVAAVGDCACGCGILKPTYAGCAGAKKTLPVFIEIPGCPPRPQDMIAGILRVMEEYE